MILRAVNSSDAKEGSSTLLKSGGFGYAQDTLVTGSGTSGAPSRGHTGTAAATPCRLLLIQRDVLLRGRKRENSRQDVKKQTLTDRKE